MTRDNLIQAIYDNGDTWSCPSYNCDFHEIEGNESAFCIMCADRQLAEYEAKIRADTIEEFVRKYKEWLKTDSDFCEDKDCDGMCIDCFVKESEKNERNEHSYKNR